MNTTHFHSCGFAVPQINTVPSIRWETLQAPCAATPTDRYQGHLPGSGVQKHSADPLFAKHGVHLRCIEGANGRRIWQAIDKHGVIIAAHPTHNGCALIAHAALNGA